MAPYQFRTFYGQQCLKCGQVMGVSYPRLTLDQKIDRLPTHTVEYCDVACAEIKECADQRRALPDHLHKRCTVCGWTWIEVTKDTAYEGSLNVYPKIL